MYSSNILEPTLTIEPDGTQCWYLNGNLHREDGPAIIYPDGSSYWFYQGNLHRIDGPAVYETENGNKEWWLYGKEMDPMVHFIKVGELNGRE